MSTAREYREYADECFGWAKTAKSDQEREIFLEMARTWLEAATQAEAKQAPDPQSTTRSGRGLSLEGGSRMPIRS